VKLNVLLSFGGGNKLQNLRLELIVIGEIKFPQISNKDVVFYRSLLFFHSSYCLRRSSIFLSSFFGSFWGARLVIVVGRPFFLKFNSLSLPLVETRTASRSIFLSLTLYCFSFTSRETNLSGSPLLSLNALPKKTQKKKTRK